MKIPTPLRLALAGMVPVVAFAAVRPDSSPLPCSFRLLTPQFKLVSLHRGFKAAPHIRDADGNSTNWAGYAGETNLSDPSLGVVSAVAGTWVVPTVTGNRTAAYSAAWVGIDGFEDAQLTALFSQLSTKQRNAAILATQTVEQIGTSQDWTGKKAQYYAWLEFYPQNAYEIEGFPVSPGQTITGSVTYLGSNKFLVELTNITENVSFAATMEFSGDRYSAEWIAEAPSSSTSILPLADFGTINFSNCSATIDGAQVPISGTSWEQIDMVSGKTEEAAASALNSGGSAFSVTWLNQ
jgi:hypothetical protein